MIGTKNQKELIRQKRQKEKNKQKILITVIVLVITLILLVLIFLPQLLKNKGNRVDRSNFSLGNKEAPIKVIEFSDFRCSHCRNTAEQIEPIIIEEYVNTGEVYLTFVNFAFLAPDSIDAAEASYCAANQNAFWEMKEILFSKNTYDGVYSPDNLLNYAFQLGLDQNLFQTCLEENQHLEDIDADFAYGKAAGVTGTPYFLVNDILVGSTDLINTIESELAKLNSN